MVMLVLFALGAIIGRTLGVFSLVVVQMIVGAATFVARASDGFGVATLRSAEMAMIVVAGFLVSMVFMCLTPTLERGVAQLDLRQKARDRQRGLGHRP